MEFRRLGASGFKVPCMSLGTGTFGAADRPNLLGSVDVAEARELIAVCMDNGLNMFDSADIYGGGMAERILGEAIQGRPRDSVIITTKAGVRLGPGANDVGASRWNLLRAVDAALVRLKTDYIDVFYLHGFDALTPLDEIAAALDDVVRDGKVRYLGASSFAGWELMKALAVADRGGRSRYVAHQVYYSLVGRDYEWELAPLGADQGVGAVVWSPLAGGRLTGKTRQGATLSPESRLAKAPNFGPPVDSERLNRVLGAMDAVAVEVGKTLGQVALNWLLQRPTVATVLIGARNAAQLQENLGALGWTLSVEQMAALDAASAAPMPYPLWQQAKFPERNPLVIPAPKPAGSPT